MFSRKAGRLAPCVTVRSAPSLRVGFMHCTWHNRGEPIRVASVVVVDIAPGIHVPRVVGVAAIARPETDVLSVSLTPKEDQ